MERARQVVETEVEMEKLEATYFELFTLHYQEMELDSFHRELVDEWEKLERYFLQAN